MYFLHKAHHGLFALRKTRKHFSSTLGDHFKQWSHNKKDRNVKNMIPVDWKGHWFIVWEVVREGRASASWASADSVCLRWFRCVLCSTCQWVTTERHKHWFWGYRCILVCRQMHKSGICIIKDGLYPHTHTRIVLCVLVLLMTQCKICILQHGILKFNDVAWRCLQGTTLDLLYSY